MRLPALTVEQERHERSRQEHEALYQGFLDGTTVTVPVTPDTVMQVQNTVSSTKRSFWGMRGFRIRTKTNADKTVLSVWLEQDGRATELDAAILGHEG